MELNKLRETLGFFSTGVIIACARRKNFLSIVPPKLLQSQLASKIENGLSEKFLLKIKKAFSAEFFGMTINSFTSVSLHPPLVSFCVDNRSANLKFFKKNRHFSLNILAKTQQDLASAFATPRNSKKWGVETYSFGKKGSPIFQNSVAFIECKKHRVIKCGDHHIIIGEVIDCGKMNDDEPLIFYKGKFL